MSNKSGYMLHGAAHGSGIYLAPNSGTSGGYMRSGRGWEKSQVFIFFMIFFIIFYFFKVWNKYKLFSSM